MLTIDSYSYSNRLKNLHPVEKTLFALVSLLACLVFHNKGLFVFVILAMGFSIIAAAGISLKFYLRLLSFPLPFVLVSIGAVMISVTRDATFVDYDFNIFNLFVGFKQSSLAKGVNILLRTYACVSCLYFISLTTPIVDIAWIMKRMKISPIFIELFTIIYKFIFVLIDTAVLIKTSQDARLGYCGLKRSFVSSGSLITNIFIKALQNYRHLSRAMEARLYTGELKGVDEQYSFSKKNITVIGGYLVILVFVIVV